jgi:hypothetical protein
MMFSNPLEANPQPPQPTVGLVTSRRDGRGLRVAGLALAGLLLGVSLATGIWLIVVGGRAPALTMPGGSGPISLGATRADLTAVSKLQIYGGDAYTGIQNAAADTEHSVVDGVNALAAEIGDLDNARATFDRDVATATAQAHQKQLAHLSIGVGVAVVGIGIATFTVALFRYADSTA